MTGPTTDAQVHAAYATQLVKCPTCDHPHLLEMEQVERCNLCGAQDEEFLFLRGDLALGLPGEFRVVRCRQCGLIYLNPRPTVRAIGYYYPAAYACFNLPALAQEDAGRPPQTRDKNLARRCQLVAKHRAPGRLLDVGCSDGRFLHQMQQLGGWECIGVELMDDAAAVGRQRYGLTILTGVVEAVDLPLHSFDVITLWDVLEHVHDPAGVLQRVAELLRPGGVLLFSVPLLDSLGGRVFGKYWIGYETPRHLHIFTRKTVQQYLRNGGFQVLQETVLNRSSHAFADSLRFWLRGHGAPRTLYGGIHWLMYSAPWQLVTAPFFKILDWRKVTTPMTFVARSG